MSNSDWYEATGGQSRRPSPAWAAWKTRCAYIRKALSRHLSGSIERLFFSEADDHLYISWWSETEFERDSFFVTVPGKTVLAWIDWTQTLDWLSENRSRPERPSC